MTGDTTGSREAARYLFVAGAPGSRWSAVAASLHRSADCDRSDASADRHYAGSGRRGPMHQGAYWDPGMEFGERFDRLDELGREACEAAFDAPFTGHGLRVVKSHCFCHHLAFLRETWPGDPLVLVHRPDAACLDWWLEAGGFDISYPDYGPYYRDLPTMAARIEAQNSDLLRFVADHVIAFDIRDSAELCGRLGIASSAPLVDFEEIDTRVALVT